MSRRGQTQAPFTRAAEAPAFDARAAEALAVVTLLVTGEQQDLELAGVLIDEVLESPDGERRLVHGLSSVCAGLVILLECFGGFSPGEGLHELGRIISDAASGE